MPILTQGLL